MAVYKVYCDESRQTKYRYMLVGGIWIPAQEGWNFVNDFEGFCLQNLKLDKKLGHMKWTKVPPPSNKLFGAYQHLVDLYFQYNAQQKMFFRTVIVDTTTYDFNHPVFSAGDYEQGFYNIYCQLLIHWLQKGNEYHIRIGQRNVRKAFDEDCERFRLESLQEKLNRKFDWLMNKHWEIYGHRKVNPPVKTIESRDASTKRLIQLADLLMGAVGFYWNDEYIKNQVKPGKRMLAQHIACKLHKKNLKFSTNWNDKLFNVFFFDTTGSLKNKAGVPGLPLT